MLVRISRIEYCLSPTLDSRRKTVDVVFASAVSCQSGQGKVCGVESEDSPMAQVEKMLARDKSPGAKKPRSPRKPRTSRAEQMVNRMSIAFIISYPPNADFRVHFPSHAPGTTLVAL